MQHSEPRPANRRNPAPASLLAATLLTALNGWTQAQTAFPSDAMAQGAAPVAAPGVPAPAAPAPGAGGAPVQPAAPAAQAPQGAMTAPGAAPAAPAAAVPQPAAPPAAPLAGAMPVQPFPGAAMGAPGYNAAVPQRPGALPQPGRPAFAAPPPAARAPVPALPTVQSPPVKGLPADAPKLVINGGVHSPNPARRRVIVNGQVVREGADLGAGVVLEQIKPDSVVLGFRGEHFHVMY